jgi:hypothetical protein
MSIVTIGIDVGKTWFHLVGLHGRGAITSTPLLGGLHHSYARI